jgi:EAL domain-containing protein (putative c-di-GMP-specific phosphodiesterase class I)
MTIRKKNPDGQMRWYLESSSDEERQWMVAIESFPYIIGRDKECNLKLSCKLISRRHSEIRKSRDHLWIRDLGSTNGTFVNYHKINQAELIEPGDVITIGKTRFNVKRVDITAGIKEDATVTLDVFEKTNYTADLEPRLRSLLSERKVIPHFQPIIMLSDMSLVGYEILGRVNHEELPSNPTELFDIAGWAGCSSDLSSLFREVGVDISRSLPGAPLLFINTTPLEIYQMNDLLASLEKIHTMVPPNRIILEINEKAVTGKNEMVKLRKVLEKFRIGLAFDDFGVGQTRLADLAKAPPDYLKFDMSLIREIHLAPQRLHQMVSTFVKATQELGIATLAEGIECADEAETCQLLRFEYAQGFFFGKPLPINHIHIRK